MEVSGLLNRHVGTLEMSDNYVTGYEPVSEWSDIGDDAIAEVMVWLELEPYFYTSCEAVLVVDGVRYENTRTSVSI
jgi:hypothetical protein